MKTRIKNLIFIIILIAIGFGFGFYYEKSQIPPAPIQGVVNQEIGKPEGVDFSLFWDAWRKLQDTFVDPQKFNIQSVVYGAISGMVNSLGDPYTVFFSPNEKQKFVQDVQGSFEGIGAEIGLKNGQLIIIAPLENTPAQRAGLRAGDQIIKINDKSTSNLTIDEAIGLIRGQKGTEVTLNIFRDGWQTPKDIKIIRDTINVPSLKWELKDNNIAYIRLYQFSQNTTSDFEKAASEISKTSADRIILDLRDNPGGYLEVSQDIASWFLKKGDIVVIEDFGAKGEKNEFRAYGPAKFVNFPMVVLVNEGSASASEILAGALRDDRDIQLIGEKTFGKGSVQELTDLKSGSALKITVAKWLTPKGISISEQGLEPDIKVEITDTDIKAEKDPQLDKAIEIVNQLKF